MRGPTSSSTTARRIRGDAGVPRALRRRRDRRPRRGRPQEADADERTSTACWRSRPASPAGPTRAASTRRRLPGRSPTSGRPGSSSARRRSSTRRRPARTRRSCSRSARSGARRRSSSRRRSPVPPDRPRARPTVLQGLSIDNTQFVSSIVFDQTKPGAPPKSKFGYLFPSDRGALISIRLRPGHLRVGPSRRDRSDPAQPSATSSSRSATAATRSPGCRSSSRASPTSSVARSRSCSAPPCSSWGSSCCSSSARRCGCCRW